MTSNPATSNLITYELVGAVAVIGVNRPDKRNAINDDVVFQLRDAVVRAGEEAAPARSLPGMGDHPSAMATYGAIVTALYQRERDVGHQAGAALRERARDKEVDEGKEPDNGRRQDCVHERPAQHDVHVDDAVL